MDPAAPPASGGGDHGNGDGNGLGDDAVGVDGSGGPAAAHRPVAASRSEARERAMHLLYEAETRGISQTEVLDSQVLAPDPFTVELVSGVGRHLDEVDGLIGTTSHDWPLARMPAMDRAVLRLATYELVDRPDVPTAVVLDEAVELAKRYSTEDSGRFVNGVLAAIATQVRPPSATGGAEPG